MTPVRPEYYPFILLVLLSLGAIIIFWSVMDMVLLGASLAIVLFSIYKRIAARIQPVFAAAALTLLVLAGTCAAILVTLAIFSANASSLSEMFGTIGVWLNNPATNPMAYGVPINKGNLAILLDEAFALFIDYKATLVTYLPTILFKMFVFFFTLFVLFIRGEEIRERLFSHVPEPVQKYVDRLSGVTTDTLYTIYVVQIAIALLTFFIAIPVFWLLGYGNILFYSFFAAFCELIPILGSSVAFIIIGAYALALGDTRGVLILFFLGYLVVSLVPEVYIRPALVGRRVKINFLIMFIGIVGGLMTMGLAGFVLGPLIIVLIITSYRIYTEEKKERDAGSDI
ncbi:AI-2E family transporter [Methanoregula sp.]|uniref:AI-2E family transporter n=1 Tax=Methanoregula sp. TaxID=2052170 RepID=UPI00356AC593